MRTSKKRTLRRSLILLATATSISYACTKSAVETPAPVVVAPAPAPEPEETAEVPAAPSMPAPTVKVSSHRLMRDTLGEVLTRNGVGMEDALAAIDALRPEVHPRRMRPSDTVGVRTEDGRLTELRVQRIREDGVPQTVRVLRGANGFTVQTEAPEVRVERQQLAGTVTNTLYESMIALGEAPSLINQVVDTFGSQVDFYREVQNGDAFRMIIEKRFAGDRFIGYGKIVAAEYKQSWRTLRGFFHEEQNGRTGYFDDRGQSLLTAFLRTPMEFTRITSRYGMRFHPVLRKRKAHNGVDYGAPRGTPVWTVADGRVVSARYDGACGNAVMIQHSNGILTGYCHLSRFGSGIKSGVRVNQKQIIGYVGNTGRSTAPHLHFLMKKHGRYVNPQRVEAPRRAGLSGDELARFQSNLPALLAELESIPSA